MAKKSPRTGRPPLADEDKRDKMIRVLVTESEKSEMEALARRRGLTASTWMRALALDALTESASKAR